jgi:hypothetical protein
VATRRTADGESRVPSPGSENPVQILPERVFVLEGAVAFRFFPDEHEVD